MRKWRKPQRNPRRYQRWTADELREIETSVSAGHKTLGMAINLGRSVSAIRQAVRIYKRGLLIERQTLTVYGHRQIAHLFGVHSSVVYRWIRHGMIDGTYERIEQFIRNSKYWPFWEIEAITDPDIKAIALRYRGRMEWLTPEQAAPLYGVSVSHVRKLAMRGEIEADRVGGKWIIRRPS